MSRSASTRWGRATCNTARRCAVFWIRSGCCGGDVRRAEECRFLARSAHCATAELHANLAIQRIRPAAAERDGEAHQAPEQRVFVPALQPRETSLPIDAGDDQHFERGCRGPEAREQAEHDAY